MTFTFQSPMDAFFPVDNTVSSGAAVLSALGLADSLASGAALDDEVDDEVDEVDDVDDEVDDPLLSVVGVVDEQPVMKSAVHVKNNSACFFIS